MVLAYLPLNSRKIARKQDKTRSVRRFAGKRGEHARKSTGYIVSCSWMYTVQILCPIKCVHCPANDIGTQKTVHFCPIPGLSALGTTRATRGGVNAEIFFPKSMDERARGYWITQRLPRSKASGLPLLSCGWTEHGTWFFNFQNTAPVSPAYVLKYREPGKRANTERWATRKVFSTREAIEFMNANKDRAFLPAWVQTNAWKPEIVAILG